MATDVYFSTNPNDWEALEGLYVAERNPPGAVRGISLATVGLAGQCVRGPLTPQLITSPERFLEVYGGRDYLDGGTLQGQVWLALQNKRFGQLVVRRVAAAAAAASDLDLSNAVPTVIATVTASSVGAWSAGASGVQVAVEAASDGDADHWDLVVTYRGETRRYRNLDTQAGVDNTAEVVGDDLGNWITVTKVADGRPVNSAAAPLTGGSDGTVAATDYTAALDDLAVEPGVGLVLIPEATPTPATVQAKLVALAPTVSDRAFLTWSMDGSNVVADEITDIGTAITTRSDRIWWFYGSAYTIDPETGTEVETGPHVWAASILSQVAEDVHLGDYDNVALLAGIKRLRWPSLTRADLISLRNAGICALERVPEGFVFRSGVTTSLVSGREQIARRRQADLVLLGIASLWRTYVKKANTATRRAAMQAEADGFLAELQAAERIVEAYSITDITKPSERQRSLQIWKIQVDLINFMLSIVVDATIGEGVTIQEVA